MSARGEEARLPLADLKPDPKNARRHNAHNIAAIKASLEQWGQRTRLVVRRRGMVVLKGNGTLEAAKALGWTELDCLLVDDDAKSGRAYAIADNRSGELAEWDEELLDWALDDIGDLRDVAWPEEPAEDGDDAPEIEPYELDVSDADVVFTIVVSGRLKDQPMVLDALRDALEGKAEDVTVDISAA